MLRAFCSNLVNGTGGATPMPADTSPGAGQYIRLISPELGRVYGQNETEIS
jgi:hypothetical protein